MAIMLSVRPLSDVQDIAFHELGLRHACGSGLITKHRNPVTDQHTLRCDYGLEVFLVGDEKLFKNPHFAYTTIGEQPRSLPVSARTLGSVTVIAARL